jgi:uncharacterized membrane protein (DUF2068 family)
MSKGEPLPDRYPDNHAGTRFGVLKRSDLAHKKGLRTVAAIEFSKGLVAVAFALGLLALLHKDWWEMTESLFAYLHINPDRRFAQTVLDLADRITDERLWNIVILAVAYSVVRFVEAYGLWRMRVWAEWMAILSGLIYLPFEIRGLIIKDTPFRWAVLVLNLVMVGYVSWVRFSEGRLTRVARDECEGASD